MWGGDGVVHPKELKLDNPLIYYLVNWEDLLTQVNLEDLYFLPLFVNALGAVVKPQPPNKNIGVIGGFMQPIGLVILGLGFRVLPQRQKPS